MLDGFKLSALLQAATPSHILQVAFRWYWFLEKVFIEVAKVQLFGQHNLGGMETKV